jgi:hypothetical protein
LVLIHKLPSCIMCRDKAAALATGACILEVLVLLHRPQCCIMRMDKHDVHATGACTLDVLVLIHGSPSCIMCRDRNAVLPTMACTLEALVLLHKPILHHVQGQSCCLCFKSMQYGTVGPATHTTMLHNVW